MKSPRKRVNSKHAAIGVPLIDDQVLRMLEELHALVWCGRTPWCSISGLEITMSPHVRTAFSRISGRIIIEGVGAHTELAGFIQGKQFGQLSLGERFGRE